MKKTILTSIVCLLGSLLAGVSHASPVFDINFSGDAIGSTPAALLIPPPGEVISQPNMFSNGDAFTVAENYESNGTTLNGRSVVFRTEKPEVGPVIGGTMSLFGNDADFTPGQDYTIKMDLLFNGAYGNLGASSLLINIHNTVYSYTAYQAQVYFSDNRIILLSNGDQSIFHNQWSADELIALEIRMLYSSNKAEVLVNNNFVGSIELNAGDPKGVYGFQFTNADANNSHFEVAIGNIKAEAIPEPGVASIIALGGAALYSVKRLQGAAARRNR